MDFQSKLLQVSTANKSSIGSAVAVTGPTGTGKTRQALTLVEEQPEFFEFVNVDSMQIYRELAIGNNKEPITTLPAHAVHGFDLVSVTENYSAAQFQEFARVKVCEIQARGRVPLLVGGSGLYLAAVLCDYQFSESNSARVKQLSSKPASELQKLITVLGFSRQLEEMSHAERNNPRRLANLIARTESGSSHDKNKFRNKSPELLVDTKLHYPRVDWVELRQKLRQRAQVMLDSGLIAEAEFLQSKKGVSEVVLMAAGYRQVLELIRSGQNPREHIAELVEKITTAHYQLAKRQQRWVDNFFLLF